MADTATPTTLAAPTGDTLSLFCWFADRFQATTLATGDSRDDQLIGEAAFLVNRFEDLAYPFPDMAPESIVLKPPTREMAERPAPAIDRALLDWFDRAAAETHDRPLGDVYRDGYDDPAVWEVAMALKLSTNLLRWARRLAYDAAGEPLVAR